MRRLSLVALVLLLLLTPSSLHVQGSIYVGDAAGNHPSLQYGAESGIVVIDSRVEKAFPDRATFILEAESVSDVVDVRLCYIVDRMTHAEVVSEGWADFVPAMTVEAVWEWDMTNASLPPGAEVMYWWTIVDADGSRLETAPEVMRFDDHRYSWQSLTSTDFLEECGTAEGVEVTLFWYQGDQSFARDLMDACEAGLVRLTTEIGTCPERPIEIYIYASTDDLRGAMIFPQEWTGGVAYTEFSTIAIGIPPSRREWGKRALVHELTHLVVHQVTFSPYGRLPMWLDEGLAMYNEGSLEPQFRSRLEKAVSEDTLISVRSLCSPFSAVTEQAYLSYAQSYSLVEYLLDRHGRDRMLDLLAVLTDGATYDEALIEVYGFDIDGLDAGWRATLGNTGVSTQSRWPDPAAIALSAVLGALLIALAAALLRRRVRRGSSRGESGGYSP